MLVITAPLVYFCTKSSFLCRPVWRKLYPEFLVEQDTLHFLNINSSLRCPSRADASQVELSFLLSRKRKETLRSGPEFWTRRLSLKCLGWRLHYYRKKRALEFLTGAILWKSLSSNYDVSLFMSPNRNAESLCLAFMSSSCLSLPIKALMES